MKSRIPTLTVVLFISVPPAYSPHAFAAKFDLTQPIKLQGVVSKYTGVLTGNARTTTPPSGLKVFSGSANVAGSTVQP